MDKNRTRGEWSERVVVIVVGGYAVAQSVEAQHYKLEGRGYDS